jgi:hypothetical protein
VRSINQLNIAGAANTAAATTGPAVADARPFGMDTTMLWHVLSVAGLLLTTMCSRLQYTRPAHCRYRRQPYTNADPRARGQPRPLEIARRRLHPQIYHSRPPPRRLSEWPPTFPLPPAGWKAVQARSRNAHWEHFLNLQACLKRKPMRENKQKGGGPPTGHAPPPRRRAGEPSPGLGLGLGLLQRPAVARSWSHPGSWDCTVKHKRCVTEIQVATVRRSKQACTKAPSVC